ncbi:oxidoreductase, partial [Clostridioides difficile]|nr:oxidoreductase [Clostridioides difficile]
LIATKAALDNMSPEFIKEFLKHVPLNRIGEPDDIAKAVLFDDSSFITGDLLEVAGGFGLPTPQFADNILG